LIRFIKKSRSTLDIYSNNSYIISMKREKQNQFIHIKVTPEIHAKLKELAEKQGRTLTELVREAIGKLLLEYSKFDINNPNQ